MQHSQNWDKLIENQNGHPLQLFGWGEVKKHTGAWRVLQVARANVQDASANFAQILVRKTPLGSFGYIPRGPNLTDDFLQELRTVAVREKLFMLRFEPNVKAENWHIWRAKLKHPKDHILLNRTVQLDLKKPAETLLAEMDATTRQNIRRGERNAALSIRQATKEDLPRILEIYHETAARSNFPLHPDTYYRTIYDQMAGHNHIYVAVVDGKVESFVWCIKTPAICFELYGGGTSVALKHRANYLLKWQAILTAQKSSKVYDINGLLNDGISDFKRGFSAHKDGHATETVIAHTGDLVIKPFTYFLFSVLLGAAKRFLSAR
jgi:lipid II:glycine glycyltransferase (peptidoglycan interpeptide bridge formation enzyme)